MRNNILFILKISILILLIQVTYLFESIKTYFIIPLLLISFFIIIIKRTTTLKDHINDYAKNLIIILVVIFTIYNIVNCIKLIISSNEASDFIKTIEINNNNDYHILLNKYKNLYNIKNAKEIELKFETDNEKHSTRFKNAIFSYDKTQISLKGRNILN